MEDNNLFRKKSLASVESPDALNQYMRVTSPGVWVIFGAVIVLLIGAFIWGIFGKLETKTDVAVVAEKEKHYALVPQNAMETVLRDRTIVIDGVPMSLTPESIEPVTVESNWDVYTLIAGKLSVGDIVFPIPVEGLSEEGVFTGTVVSETISPISFLFN